MLNYYHWNNQKPKQILLDSCWSTYKNMLYGAIISQRKLVTGNFQDFGSNLPEVFLGKGFLKICIMSKCHFNKFVLQFNWNHTLAWMFSSKFAAYFQSTFVIRTLTEGCFCELLLPSFALFLKNNKRCLPGSENPERKVPKGI